MSIRGYRPRLYGIWLKMRGRCNTTTDSNFPYYGGRGISVCQEWDAYECFHHWAMTNGYSDALTLDRIDNDGNYEPGNCRWATQKEQCRNRRRNIMIAYGGETLPLIAWAERTGLPYAMLRSRFKMGWSPAELLGMAPRIKPPKRRRRGAKMTEDGARDIRQSSESGSTLARKYGVSRALVSHIKNGRLWRELPPHESVEDIRTRGPLDAR